MKNHVEISDIFGIFQAYYGIVARYVHFGKCPVHLDKRDQRQHVLMGAASGRKRMEIPSTPKFGVEGGRAYHYGCRALVSRESRSPPLRLKFETRSALGRCRALVSREVVEPKMVDSRPPKFGKTVVVRALCFTWLLLGPVPEWDRPQTHLCAPSITPFSDEWWRLIPPGGEDLFPLTPTTPRREGGSPVGWIFLGIGISVVTLLVAAVVLLVRFYRWDGSGGEFYSTLKSCITENGYRDRVVEEANRILAELVEEGGGEERGGGEDGVIVGGEEDGDAAGQPEIVVEAVGGGEEEVAEGGGGEDEVAVGGRDKAPRYNLRPRKK
ncbi:hypothetical protein Fcan01_27447 [Folsomia candida]|uniref:Uncharacterized protein n=1 Tax=Folsomia candida TaxID=158441 RepID=A0A226CWR3_FOLCA|nr:hypothetical protein Fcan01_27447 [Folsomia candida]